MKRASRCPGLRQSPRSKEASKSDCCGGVLQATPSVSYSDQVTETLSITERSKRMGLIRSRDTKPEMIVRRLVHSMGYRHRLHAPELPGRPDLVFRPRKRVVFVHGCFWHRHDDPNCKLARLPKSRQDFWLPKLSKNAERDAQHIAALEKMGWRVLTIWECQLKDASELKENIRRFLEDGIHAID